MLCWYRFDSRCARANVPPMSVDEQYTHIPGILGLSGISQAAAEDDLGGLVVRVRVVVGR